MTAADPDVGDTLTYGLYASGDHSHFAIDTASGQLRTSGALDYESDNRYAVTVSDGNGGTASIDVTIAVTDEDEASPPPGNRAPSFTEGATTSRSVAENTPSGAAIGDPVRATDPDGDTLRYALLPAVYDGDHFAIDSSSGQLRTSGALDYESDSRYAVVVFVWDRRGGRETIDVTINVTEAPVPAANTAPSFTEGATTSRSAAENTASGTASGDPVTATDPDVGDTLTYGLDASGDHSHFAIDTASGQLRTSGALDYEGTSSYAVTVTVSDGNGGTASIDVTITVGNVNEAPSFDDGGDISVEVAENTAIGAASGAPLTAADPDVGDTLTYGLDASGDHSHFAIDTASGQLRTSGALDYESSNSYAVTVTVRDGNVNEAPSFDDGGDISVEVAENTASGTAIGAPLTAADPDGAP